LELKNGFRRIAHTYFFAFSPSPTHTSRQIPASADFDPPAFTGPQLSPEDRERQFPAHVFTASVKSPGIDGVLRMLHAADPSSITKADENGYTPIWIAAAAGNVEAARTLTSLFTLTHPPPNVHPDLTSRQNDAYLTPLEKVAESMRSEREFS
jgi:hypothetical protein